MLSPYEELEFLADFLPDEGEAVVVTRQGGNSTASLSTAEISATGSKTSNSTAGSCRQTSG